MELNFSNFIPFASFPDGTDIDTGEQGYNDGLDRAEASFGMVIEDYAANLKLLDLYIVKILDKLQNNNI